MRFSCFPVPGKESRWLDFPSTGGSWSRTPSLKASRLTSFATASPVSLTILIYRGDHRGIDGSFQRDRHRSLHPCSRHGLGDGSGHNSRVHQWLAQRRTVHTNILCPRQGLERSNSGTVIRRSGSEAQSRGPGEDGRIGGSRSPSTNSRNPAFLMTSSGQPQQSHEARKILRKKEALAIPRLAAPIPDGKTKCPNGIGQSTSVLSSASRAR